MELRVFGSVAWEALTGLRYLTPASDIDLLWWPADAAQVAEVIALLRAWESGHGIRADGEVEFDDGTAVAWREWDHVARTSNSQRRVLGKTLHGPRIRAFSDLAAQFSRCATGAGAEATACA